MRKVITIGREFGSGGREFGRRLAEALGYAYYDQEIVMEIASRTELSEQYVQQILECKPIKPFPIHVGRTFRLVENPHMVHSQTIFQEQCNILRKMAEASDCVIVGRCADYILQEMEPFRIFVYGDMESKIARCRERDTEQKSLTDRELRQNILTINKGRAQHYQLYTNQKWGDRANYDLCINTSSLDIKTAATVMAKLFDRQ